MSTRSKRKIVLKNLKKYKTIWHPESTLVYKSKKERIVIGRCVEGELVPLDEKALELCDHWNMKPDNSLIDSEHDSENDQDEEEHEGEHEGEDEGEHEGEDEGEDEGEHEGEDEAPPPVDILPEKEADVPTTEKRSVSRLGIDQAVKIYNEHSATFMSELANWNSSLSSRLQASEKKYDDLVAKYDAIKTKFDTMKSLFA